MKRVAKVQISQLNPDASSEEEEEYAEQQKHQKQQKGAPRVFSVPSRRSHESGPIMNPFKAKIPAAAPNIVPTNNPDNTSKDQVLKERDAILREIETLNERFQNAVKASMEADRHTDLSSLFPQYAKYRSDIQAHFGLLKETMAKLSSQTQLEVVEAVVPSPPKTQQQASAASPMKIEEVKVAAAKPFSFNADAAEYKHTSTNTTSTTTAAEYKPATSNTTRDSVCGEEKPKPFVFTFNPITTSGPAASSANTSSLNTQETKFQPLSFQSFAPTSTPNDDDVKAKPFSLKTAKSIEPATSNEPTTKPFSFDEPVKSSSSNPNAASTSEPAKPFSFNPPAASSSQPVKPFSFNPSTSEPAKPFSFSTSTAEQAKPFSFNPPTNVPTKPFSFNAPADKQSPSQSEKPFAFSFPSTSTSSALPTFSFGQKAEQEEEQGSDDDGESPTLPEEPVNKELVQKGAGEESEVTEWQARSKLFRFENGAWNDLGVGLAKVNLQEQAGKRRLLMRAEGTGKVLLNVDVKGVISDFKPERPSEIIMITSHDGSKYLLRSKEQIQPLDQILKSSK